MGSPLGQIAPNYAREFWVPYQNLSHYTAAGENIDFIHGRAVGLDTTRKMLTYTPKPTPTDSPSGPLTATDSLPQQSVPYDYLILATGVRRAWPVTPTALHREPYLQHAESFNAALGKAKRIVVVGGGAVGCEQAGELVKQFPLSEVVLVHSRPQLLNAEPLPDAFKAMVAERLRAMGVTVKLGRRVTEDVAVADSTAAGGFGHKLTLADGEIVLADEVVYTAGSYRANTLFVKPEFVDEKGCVQIRPTMQFPADAVNADQHFAVGDAASWTGIKRVGGAYTQASFAATNIAKILAAKEDGVDVTSISLGECPQFPPRMSLAMGSEAVVHRPGMEVRFGSDIKERAFGRGLAIDCEYHYISSCDLS
jgi:NADH dehydrogenase FAD-containing subunit